MTVLSISETDGLYYEYDEATNDNEKTFVFINAITGDASMWQADIGPALRNQGHGTIAYNFRGQANSPYADGLELTEEVIVSDLILLLETLKPQNIVLVGLSIGSLYAVKAMAKGVKVDAIVMINMLRRIGTRIQWMNDIIPQLLAAGGPNLMRDSFTHLITGPAFAEKARAAVFVDKPDYTPMDPNCGPMNLVTHMGATRWDVDYADINVPALVISGLHDRVFYDAAVFEELYALLPNATRIDMGHVGHMIPIEDPAALTKAILDFI
ncbi:MAG: alpha/beta fold hydrolase [Rhodospirillales bacterium]|nr:alpha/beta fold hydrolase [Rhodospirillales bacterium]